MKQPKKLMKLESKNKKSLNKDGLTVIKDIE